MGCSILMTADEFDRDLEASGLPNVVKDFRFVDDFLVLFKRTTENRHTQIEDLFSRFCKAFPGLTLLRNFLHEDGRIRFLDLELHFTPHMPVGFTTPVRGNA
ncbi:hypothetical protein HPB52_024936 [Rhipicephalus sanguineus]|uniref:Uncharacterized protein n=1 Tax=Rhipicephalus sanguineus TaxID=34632 RepID=A0A9D4PBI1_RHISA|nr:hypothetical protein HPB52_024936 [Rhipicephalus sanguineus]